MEFKKVEEKWQKIWNDNLDLYKAEDNSHKKKKYVLVEFPYPSGSGLHVGHAFSFTGGDVFARFKRMQGYNVLFPMGWDAFGLPTENYAIKMKKKPQQVTKENTDMFRSQMKKLAFSFDWSREVNTTDPNYYRWTQWIFIKLFENGLAYKEEMPINWCPSCKIGLANEEVLQSRISGVGVCERCGSEVSRRNISQWIVRISSYADRLIDGLKNTDFIDKVKMAQVNWIGRKEGINIDFEVTGTDQKLTVFTTTPVNFGATFLVVAPEHKFVQEIVDGKYGVDSKQIEDIKKYMSEARKKGDLERTELNKTKTGVFSGLYAKNHVTGKDIPIWITDFVLATVGTGAVQGCPGHDQRDWDFAKKFGIPIVRVVSSINSIDKDINEEPFIVHLGDKGKMVNSDFLDGMDFTQAMKKTMDYFEEKGWGKRVVSYHLRDWIFSRQHYWGEPIPMVDCPACGWVPEKEENLPIVLPEVEAYEPTDDGLSPLSRIPEFVKCVCPKCGGEAKRETDTMPNWAGSDWYYLAYCFANKLGNTKYKTQNLKLKNKEEKINLGSNDIVGDIFSSSQKEIKYWGPVDVYIGGDEHNTLHLLYSRFIYQFLYDEGVLPKELPEPYQMRMSHGVILGPDNARMSKTKGNVIVPETVADKYGVDVVRMYLMFMGPFTGTMAWNENTLMGVKRFLDRFENYINLQSSNFKLQTNGQIASSKEVKVIINKLIDVVTRDLEEFGYNTAIAKMMEALNKISNFKFQISNDDIKTLIKLIAPMAPYMTEELWSRLRQGSGEPQSVHSASWPVADPKFLVEDEVTIMVAVNGKTRDQIIISNDKCQMSKEILEQAKGLKKIEERIGGKKIIKEIYVPGKMVNFVVLE